ncbi:MAG: hypothetical protein GX591_08210 [Planctomycetes bacterium]|nr:hypothetical protein [Planctomycetota bacterium]
MMMNTYVPSDLNGRVDTVACEAFRRRLDEIVCDDELRELQAVIDRLHESKLRDEGEGYVAGLAAGQAWAARYASAAELANLDAWRYAGRRRPPGEAAEAFYFIMSRDLACDTARATAFWEDREVKACLGQVESAAWGGGEGSFPPPTPFVNGFAQGALELWHKVKEYI